MRTECTVLVELNKSYWAGVAEGVKMGGGLFNDLGLETTSQHFVGTFFDRREGLGLTLSERANVKWSAEPGDHSGRDVDAPVRVTLLAPNYDRPAVRSIHSTLPDENTEKRIVLMDRAVGDALLTLGDVLAALLKTVLLTEIHREFDNQQRLRYTQDA